MNWYLKSFEELSASTVYDLMQLRSEVFVVEQTCIYQDMDGKDKDGLHLYMEDAKGRVVAYARLLEKYTDTKYCSIGRVCNSIDVRGQKLGIELMSKAIDGCKQHFPGKDIKISAQVYLTRFYTDFGFEQVSEVYEEDDIPHIAMLLKVN